VVPGSGYAFVRQRVWFERWITEGYSIRQLAQQSGHSGKKLRRVIHYWLAHPPREQDDLTDFRHLVIDGSYIQGRHLAVVAIADPTRNRLVVGWYGVKEGGEDMHERCRQLAVQGLSPRSVTIDGLPQVYTIATTVWPQVQVQRCLVHVQRQGLSWCRRNPRRPDAQHLRALFVGLSRITTVEHRDQFLQAWQTWEARYGLAIARQKEHGWVFSDLKRARSMLAKALPYLFVYLDQPQVPSSTNWLESYFSRLKARYRQHRGLSPEHRQNYFTWYFHLCKK